MSLAQLPLACTDLLDSDQVEPLFLQLVAHVSAYKVVMRSWDEGDVNAWSSVTYPNTLLEYVEGEFRRLKARQATLLGLGGTGNGGGKSNGEGNGPRSKL